MDNKYTKELYHHGVVGMKWGIRRYQPYGVGYDAKHKGQYIKTKYSKGDRMNESYEHDSSVTKRVKKDYNSLSDKDFFTKYHTTRNTYRKRVNRYGDPYMNSPYAKLGKKLASNKRVQKDVSRKLNRELSKYDRIMDRLDKKKNVKDVSAMQDKYREKAQNAINTVLADEYKIRYNVATKKYEVYR